MPDNKKNPQQDQNRKGMNQGDRGQPGFNEREDREQQSQKQEGDQEMDRQRQGANPQEPGAKPGKQGVTADEDFENETDDERITQRTPQQGADTPKSDRK